MRIAHVTEAWNGGIATYVNTLAAQQAGNHEVSIIYSKSQTTNDFDRALYESLGIKTFPYASSRRPDRFVKAAQEIRTHLESFKPDIVHLHSTFPGVYGRILAANAPIVYCPHGWSFVQEKGLLKKFIYAKIEKFLARHCDAIVSISDHEYREAAKAGIKSALDVIIPSGANDVSAGTFIPSLDVDPAATNLGFIGRLDYKKGFDIAVDAIRLLKRNDVRLYVLGAASREKHGTMPDTSPRIHYCGWVDNHQIDGYMKLFDAVIVPSRQEGFGLVVVEAMRNARAAIVSAAGGLPELIEHGQNGYIFTPETLSEILENLDKQKLKAMGEHARNIYQKHYTAERFAAAVDDLYNKVLYTRKTSS